MGVPQDRKYLESHEWYLVDGNLVTIGITQFAADQLSDVAAIAAVVASADVPVDHVEFCASNYPRRAYLARHHGFTTSNHVTTTDNANYVVCASSQPDDRLGRVLELNDELALWIRVPLPDE